MNKLSAIIVVLTLIVMGISVSLAQRTLPVPPAFTFNDESPDQSELVLELQLTLAQGRSDTFKIVDRSTRSFSSIFPRVKNMSLQVITVSSDVASANVDFKVIVHNGYANPSRELRGRRSNTADTVAVVGFTSVDTTTVTDAGTQLITLTQNLTAPHSFVELIPTTTSVSNRAHPHKVTIKAVGNRY